MCERAIRRDVVGLKPRQRMPKGVTVHQYFGISTDEAARAERAKTRFAKLKWTRPVYPLLDLGWGRRDCLTYLKDRVPHPVPKSACVFCPFKTNQAWADLKANDPEGGARAVAVDEAIRSEGAACRRGMEGNLYLHHTCVPLAMLDLSAPAPDALDPMATGECTGMCGM